MEVYPGDVLVVDEASQVSTEDMGRIVEVARRCGAMVVCTGDTEQLEAVDAGGIFRLIAARHGHWRLHEVRRFRHAWERDASLRLRRRRCRRRWPSMTPAAGSTTARRTGFTMTR